jgi:signal peptidase II
MTAPARSLRGPLALAALVVIADQLTKHWAVNSLDDRTIDVVWTLRLHLAFNSGMAFSRGDGLGPIIGVIALVVVVAFVVSLRRSGSRWSTIGVGLIVGGAVGNIVDRLFRDPGWLRGRVVDFIDLQWWPIFNVADIGITVGALMLLVGSLTTREST